MTELGAFASGYVSMVHGTVSKLTRSEDRPRSMFIDDPLVDDGADFRVPDSHRRKQQSRVGVRRYEEAKSSISVRDRRSLTNSRATRDHQSLSGRSLGRGFPVLLIVAHLPFQYAVHSELACGRFNEAADSFEHLHDRSCNYRMLSPKMHLDSCLHLHSNARRG